jgi:hypothetical protein
MSLTVELTTPTHDFDAEALAQAVARLGALVADTTRVRLNVTSDFDHAVRHAVRHDPAYAVRYTRERDVGFAVAKTITQPDGTIDVIVDAGLFSRAALPGDAARTFEHEALHIAIEERGESLNDLRGHRPVAESSSARIFASMAGVSAEEYRVERVLWRRGPGAVRSDSHRAQFGEIAWRIEGTIRAASSVYERGLDLPLIGRAVSDAFLALATSTAYVAAEIDATGGERDVDVAADVYARLLGPRWRAVIDELRRLPPGDVPTRVDRLDVQAYRVAGRLEDWLAHIGFSWVDGADGALSFGVLNAGRWRAPAAVQPRMSAA